MLGVEAKKEMDEQNRKAFLASLLPEPRERCQTPGPSLPRAGTAAHCRIPSRKTLHHTSVSGGSAGKDCLPGTSNIADLVCPFLYTTCALLLTSCWWALFQNYLFLRCLYVKELGNPGSQAWLLFLFYILSHKNGLKSCEVHLCSNFIFIQLICWTDGCRFKCPGCSLLARGCKAGQNPHLKPCKRQRSASCHKAKTKFRCLQGVICKIVREITLVFSFLYKRPEDSPAKIFEHIPKSRPTE